MTNKINFNSIKKKLKFIKKFGFIPLNYVNSHWTVVKIVLKTGVYLVFTIEAVKFIAMLMPIVAIAL
jgi:hypothetical protein